MKPLVEIINTDNEPNIIMLANNKIMTEQEMLNNFKLMVDACAIDVFGSKMIPLSVLELYIEHLENQLKV